MISLNRKVTEDFNIVCPYCGKENKANRGITTDWGYDGDVDISINDFNFSCNYCQSEMKICPREVKMTITECEVEKNKRA